MHLYAQMIERAPLKLSVLPHDIIEAHLLFLNDVDFGLQDQALQHRFRLRPAELRKSNIGLPLWQVWGGTVSWQV